jgi:N-acetylmuramoyl-L-alanine amidase
MKVCVDAGHGGSDPGAVGTDPFRLAEKEVTLQVSLLLEQELEQRGHQVLMTRRRDRTLGLLPRARFANRLRADLFVSIHANAAATASAEGIEVYHFPDSREGGRAAVAVLQSLVTAFPDHRNRGVKQANFAVLRETEMPAILIETEFITNPRQLEFLSDPESQEALGEAVADGLEAIPELVWRVVGR